MRTVKSDNEEVLQAANLLQSNLQFIIETTKTSGKLAFLDLRISIEKKQKIICEWYQKLTDTGTILNCKICAAFQYKRGVIEGTVQRVFRSTSTRRL